MFMVDYEQPRAVLIGFHPNDAAILSGIFDIAAELTDLSEFVGADGDSLAIKIIPSWAISIKAVFIDKEGIDEEEGGKIEEKAMCVFPSARIIYASWTDGKKTCDLEKMRAEVSAGHF
jgi:hypothetical protein